MNGIIGEGIARRRLGILLTAAAATSMVGHSIPAQEARSGQVVAAPEPAKVSQAQKPHTTEGERVFAANCSRCHTAPDGFSSRISGTVVRHMRVRASLSEQDEKALLKFFNPQ